MSSRRNIPRRPNRGQVIARHSTAAPSLIGATGFADSTAFYKTAAPGGYQGTSGMYFGALVKVTSQAVASKNRFLGGIEATSSGYTIFAGATYSTLTGRVYDGAGANKDSPAYTIVAGDVNKVLSVLAVHDGSFIRLYVNGVQVGAGTAITGYTAPAGAATYLGARSNAGGQSWDAGGVIYGLVAGAGVPVAANAAAWGAACKAAYGVVAIPTFTPAQLVSFTNPIGATLTATNGDNMTRTGTPTQVTETSPTWGF